MPLIMTADVDSTDGHHEIPTGLTSPGSKCEWDLEKTRPYFFLTQPVLFPLYFLLNWRYFLTIIPSLHPHFFHTISSFNLHYFLTISSRSARTFSTLFPCSTCTVN